MPLAIGALGLNALGVMSDVLGFAEMGGLFGEDASNQQVLDALDEVRDEISAGILTLQLQGLANALSSTDEALADLPADPSRLAEWERIDIIDDAEEGLAATVRNARSIFQADPEKAPLKELIDAVAYALSVRAQVAMTLEDGAFAKQSIREDMRPAIELIRELTAAIDLEAAAILDDRAVENGTTYVHIYIFDTAMLGGGGITKFDLSLIASRLGFDGVHTTPDGYEYLRLPIVNGVVTFDGNPYVVPDHFGKQYWPQLSMALTTAIEAEAKEILGELTDRLTDLISGEEIYGGRQDDDIAGSAFGDVIDGEGGNDLIRGLDGNDILFGGAGDDTIFGDHGSDRYEGGAGDDMLVDRPGGGTDFAVFSGNAEDYTLTVTGFLKNAVLVEGADGTDTAVNIEFLVFDDMTVETADLASFDTIVATGLRGEAIGGGGDEYLRGGDDALGASSGGWFGNLVQNAVQTVIDRMNDHDTLRGGAGDDTLDGESGRDVLEGGAGRDAFVLGSGITPHLADTILDFESGVDTIILDRAFFKALANGVKDGNLVHGPSARDADDFLVQDGNRLLYDADGNGAGEAIHVATIGNGARLDAADFLVLTDEALLV